MPILSPRPKNLLLAALRNGELQRWLPHLEAVKFPLGQVLYESGDALNYVYFPTTAIISLLYVLESGATATIAVVGHEGVIGISLFLGGESTSNRAVVQCAGQGYRLKAEAMKDEFNRGGPVLRLLLRYTQAFSTQVLQSAACSGRHSLDQQLCRWLLLSLDCLEGDEFTVTDEFISHTLGVRPGDVTEAIMKLQDAELIRYSHGHVIVLDRPGIEQRACECYAVVKKECDRLLPNKVAC